MDKYNQLYTKKKYVRGVQPNNLTTEILNYKEGGLVLDLGCGEGQDAIFLSKQGFEVVGVDTSTKALENLKELAIKHGVRVKTELKDIRTYSFGQCYDVILAEATIHFLREDERSNYINLLKMNTNFKGLNVIGVFNEETCESQKEGMKYWGISPFKVGELLEYYTDWRLLLYKLSMRRKMRNPSYNTPNKRLFIFGIGGKYASRR